MSIKPKAQKVDWISCRDQLPPRSKWVMVRSLGDDYIAKRCGIFYPHWKFRSKIVKDIISRHDKWKPIEESVD